MGGDQKRRLGSEEDFLDLYVRIEIREALRGEGGCPGETLSIARGNFVQAADISAEGLAGFASLAGKRITLGRADT